MHLTCKCLNVSIKIKGNKLCKFNNEDIEFNANEKVEAFFQSDIMTTNALENITKEQPGLVEIRNVGSWAIYRCYNCQMYTHAVHRKYGASMILIASNVISSEEEIVKLKASPIYSPIFRVIIDRKRIEDLDANQPLIKYSVSQLSTNSRLAIGGLQQQLEEAIQRQTILIDERIRLFTKEQYEILEEFRERAHTEHSLLERLIYSEQQVGVSTNLETPPTTPPVSISSSKCTLEDDVDTAPFNAKKSIYKNSSTKQSKVQILNGNNDNDTRTKDLGSYDGDTIFMFDEMDDIPFPHNNLEASDHESDTDDSGNELVEIPRIQRTGHPMLAKSLPVTVPVFHSFNQRSILDEDDEQISRNPIDPHNIQASIKALAKSVHGDTIFGDLPRPRFSTQI